jgi:protein ImuA
MSTHLLKRASDRERPQVTLLPDIGLSVARAHEVCGPARRWFALWVARMTKGPVLWASPAWERDQLFPAGVRDLVDPGRLLFARPPKSKDLLWIAEEALRAGAVPLVVIELLNPPALTPVRRLHLAADEGGQVQRPAPLALLLTPDRGGAQGVESRWHMAPVFGNRTATWRLERLRARTAPPRSWLIEQPERGADLRFAPGTAANGAPDPRRR